MTSLNITARSLFGVSWGQLSTLQQECASPLPNEDFMSYDDQKGIINLAVNLHRVKKLVINHRQSIIHRIIDLFTGVHKKRKLIINLLKNKENIETLAQSIFDSTGKTFENEYNQIHRESIIKKTHLINLAQIYFNDPLEKANNPHWTDVADEINEFFKTCITNLDNNRDIALPKWYHATRSDTLPKIIQSGKLIRTPAGLGFGVYVSTNDEFYSGYGKGSADGPTIVFDDEPVYERPASFYNGNCSYFSLNRHRSLWVRIHDDLPIKFTSVAYIAVAKPHLRATRQKVYSEYNYFPHVISREASDCIRYIFDSVKTQRRMPGTWRRYYSLSCIFPRNISW